MIARSVIVPTSKAGDGAASGPTSANGQLATLPRSRTNCRIRVALLAQLLPNFCPILFAQVACQR